MQNYIIITDAYGKELNSHGKPWYPIAGYDEYFSTFTLKEVAWHWHPEIELILVQEGATKVHCLGNIFELHVGECLFINSNILHRLTQIGDIDCHIITFVLNPEFIGGKADSLIHQNYIRPICQNESINTIKLSPVTPMEKSAIASMNEAFRLNTIGGFGHEMLVRAELTKFWHALSIQTQELQNTTLNNYDIADQRLEYIIKYIHTHLSDKLTVNSIASSANISESECYRLFKKKLSISPMNYVLSHRIQRAASYLAETKDSIITIAINLGFGSASYFSKKFREYYGVSPRVFRKTFHIDDSSHKMSHST